MTLEAKTLSDDQKNGALSDQDIAGPSDIKEPRYIKLDPEFTE